MKKKSYISAFSVNENDHILLKFVKMTFDHIMGLPKFYNTLEQFRMTYSKESDCFFEKLSCFFSWEFLINGRENLKGDESTGPLVIFCNHPHGIADLGVIGELTRNILKRNDLLFISNSVLKLLFPELGQHSICVDNMTKNHQNRKKMNIKSFEEMKNHLNGGGALCIFPAGEVSHFQFSSLEGLFKLTDASWKKGLLKLKEETDARFIPFYIHGHNSKFFLFFRFFSKTFGRLLNFREFLNSNNKKFTAEIRAELNLEKSLVEFRKSLYCND